MLTVAQSNQRVRASLTKFITADTDVVGVSASRLIRFLTGCDISLHLTWWRCLAISVLPELQSNRYHDA